MVLKKCLCFIIYTCILLATLSFSCFANEKEKLERSPKAHTLNLSYSPVLRSAYYQDWKTVPPLKFTLNYAYDIPMRSRVVNFYAIAEASYIGAYHKGSIKIGEQAFSVKKNFDAVILSAGVGLKVHLVSFLDLAVYYTGGYRYSSCKNDVEWVLKRQERMHEFSGCAGIRLIGKINKINVFAGYSFAHLLMEDDYMFLTDHYIDIGVGYTF